MKYFPAFACVLMFISTWACALIGNFYSTPVGDRISGWFTGALVCGMGTIYAFIAAIGYLDEKGKR